jgi:hypothetical protein
MAQEYTHQELEKEVNFLAGYYIPLKESRLDYKGRDVLFVSGTSVVESSCCSGPGGCAYAIVPGYVLKWKSKTNDAGLPVTEVESISDKEERREIAAAIKDAEFVGNVDFW